MKKFLSLCLSVCLILGTFSVCTFAEGELNPTEKFFLKFEKYDADGDGIVSKEESRTAIDIDGDKTPSLSDARKVLRVAAELDEPVGADCDFNCDGTVSAEDARKAMKIALGIDQSLVDVAEITEYLCEELNSVKTEKPGFTRTVKQKCTSMKVTATGAPIEDMNANDIEYYQYLENSKKVLEKYKLLIVMASGREEYEETIAAMDEAIAQAKEIYNEQVTTKTVAKGSNYHNSYFPINYYSWACRLTEDDIKEITYGYDDDYITITAKLDDYKYTSKNYPYSSSSTDELKRLELPYGKAFNLPNTATGGGATFNSLNLSNGKIVCKINKATGSVVSADYSYSYVLGYSQAEDVSGSTVTMKLTQAASYSENFVMLTE